MNDPTFGSAPGAPASPGNANPSLPFSAGNSAPDQPAPLAEMKDEATAKASSLVGQVQDKLASTVDDKKGGIADKLEEVADAVHRSGEQFAGKQDWIAGAIERGAAELTTLAGSLRDADVGTLVQQVQSFAKRQPALFVGASLAAGFALARVGKIVAADVSRDDLPTMPEVGHGQR